MICIVWPNWIFHDAMLKFEHAFYRRQNHEVVIFYFLHNLCIIWTMRHNNNKLNKIIFCKYWKEKQNSIINYLKHSWNYHDLKWHFVVMYCTVHGFYFSAIFITIFDGNKLLDLKVTGVLWCNDTMDLVIYGVTLLNGKFARIAICAFKWTVVLLWYILEFYFKGTDHAPVFVKLTTIKKLMWSVEK